MDQTRASPFTIEIHPEDHLYGFLKGRLGEERARKAYLEGGKSDATQTAATIRRFRKEPEVNILEFASGYGRVTRHLRDLLPDASLYASDIHPQACEFVTTNISVPTLPSSARPEDLSVGTGYDFIFVISLFSHLPDHSFGIAALDGFRQVRVDDQAADGRDHIRISWCYAEVESRREASSLPYCS